MTIETFLTNYWNDTQKAIDTQDATRLNLYFADDAVYKFRTNDGMIEVDVKEMQQSTLSYKEIQDAPVVVERIEKLADGKYLTIAHSSVENKPYFVTSFFTLNDDKIVKLEEYYGDF